MNFLQSIRKQPLLFPAAWIPHICCMQQNNKAPPRVSGCVDINISFGNSTQLRTQNTLFSNIFWAYRRTSFQDLVCCFVFFFGVNKKKHIHAARTLSPSGICRRAAKSRHSDQLHCLGKVKFVHCFSVTKNRFFISSCHFGSLHTTPRHRFRGCSFRQL